MANTDYTKKATSDPTPIAQLIIRIGRMDTDVIVAGFIGKDDFLPGDMLLIDKEIVRLDAINESTLTIGRGCGDTIPTEHPTGAPVWLYKPGKFADDTTPYTQTETTVSSKVLMTGGSTDMELDNSPPSSIPMQSRHMRPYPPGQVRIGGNRWFEDIILSDAVPEVNITWVNRNRLTQLATLVDHDMPEVAPEEGMFYALEVVNLDGDVLATILDIPTDEPYVLKRDDLVELLEVEGKFIQARLRLSAVRGIYPSWMYYESGIVNITVGTPPEPGDGTGSEGGL